MSATPLEARSDVTSLIAEDAVSYDDASLHDHTPAGLRHTQRRRRGWFLRRGLVAADAFASMDWQSATCSAWQPARWRLRW